MDRLGGSTEGYCKKSYYSRLDVDDDDAGEPAGIARPTSSRRRKPPSLRRPKVVKASIPPKPLFSSMTSSAKQLEASSSTSAVHAANPVRRRRRRAWRIRLTPRLAFLRRVASFPVRLVRRVQRGYVRMMLKFAGAMGGVGPEMVGYSLPRPALKEYDEKVLVEMYRALVAQGHVLVVPSSGTGTDSVTAGRLVA